MVLAGTESLANVGAVRREFGFSQSQLAALLGMSIRAVQSYEQGWRRPSANVQRLLLMLLIAQRRGRAFSKYVCWKAQKCPPERRERCMAYYSRQGHLCWFLTGTFCAGQRTRSWLAKWRLCSRCGFMATLLEPGSEGSGKVGA